MLKPQNKQKKDDFDCLIPHSRNLLLAVVCGISVIIVLTALVFYEVGIERGEARTKAKIPEELIERFSPDAVFAIEGKITEIQEKVLRIKILKPEEKEVQAKIGTGASIVNYPETPPGAIPNISKITFSDLKIGDSVVVSSEKNIAGKDVFDASSVVRLAASTSESE